MKTPLHLLRNKCVFAASHLNPRFLSSKPPLTSHTLKPAYFLGLLSRCSRNPIYPLLEIIHQPSKRNRLSERLHRAGVSQVEYTRWKPLLKEKNLSIVVKKLSEKGYITSEAAMFPKIAPDEDGVYFTPSGGRGSHPSPVPSWLLVYLVAYKVCAPPHAQGPLLNLVFSHLDLLQYDTFGASTINGPSGPPDLNAFGGLRAPILILTMLHLARFNLSLGMPTVVERFLSLPELMQTRTHREANWSEACFNLILQAALINTQGYEGSISTPSSLSPSSATLSAQVSRVLLPLVLTLSSRQLRLHRHTYNLLLQRENVALVVELAKHLRAKATREGYVPKRKELEVWSNLVLASDGDSARPAESEGAETVQDPTSPFEFLQHMVRSPGQRALKSVSPSDPFYSPNDHDAEAKTSVSNLLLPKHKLPVGKAISKKDMPGVVGVMAHIGAAGVPPPVYSNSQPLSESIKDNVSINSTPTQLWTRAFTLAAKDTQVITSRMLVYFFERAEATVSVQPPPKELLALHKSVYGSFNLSQPIRLTVSHYTTLLRGLLLRRQYLLAEKYFFALLSSGLSIDARALGAGLVILTRIAKVGTAFNLLEQYASSGDVMLPLAPEDRKVHLPIRMNTIQFNDFLLALIRFPTMRNSRAFSSPRFPLKLVTYEREADRQMHSARPDVVLSLFDTMGPLYGVWPDERSVCLMLQAVRMVGRMDDTVRGGWRLWKNLRMAKAKTTVAALKINSRSTRQMVVNQIYGLLWEPSANGDFKNPQQMRLEPRPYTPGNLWAGELPFERARKLFHRLVWAHAQSINDKASGVAKVNLRDVRPPAHAMQNALEPDAFRLWVDIPRIFFGAGTRQQNESLANLDSPSETIHRWHPFHPKSAPLPRLEATTFHQYILLLGVSSVHLSDKLGSAHTAIAEIPLVLAWMRALGIVPMQETLAAALVLWAEVAGRPPLFDDIQSTGKLLLSPDPARDATTQDASTRHDEGIESEKRDSWRSSLKPPKSEYTKLVEWMVEWVEELKLKPPAEGKVSANVEMPTPRLIWRWTDIIRLMREGPIAENDVEGFHGKDKESNMEADDVPSGERGEKLEVEDRAKETGAKL